VELRSDVCVVVVATGVNVITVKGSSIMAMVPTSLKALALAAIVGLGVLLASVSNYAAVPAQNRCGWPSRR
jgi:hypothetical protein